MSEPIPACIAIGGRLPASSVPAFCEAIIASRVATEWSRPVFAPATAAELLNARQKIEGISVLWLCNDQASWGRLRLLEQFLEDERFHSICEPTAWPTTTRIGFTSAHAANQSH